MFLKQTRTAHDLIWGYKEPILELKNRFGFGKSSGDTDDTFGMLKSVCMTFIA